ncbi:MAG: quinol oxidase [Natrialbaceae archaeon]|nr:quinol oxidase [Natrialbaceae archaeon]
MVLDMAVSGMVFVVGRAIFGAVIAFMGVNHFMGLDGMSQYAEAKGIPAPRFAAAGSGLMLPSAVGSPFALGVYPLVGGAILACCFPRGHTGHARLLDDRRPRATTGGNEQDFLKNAMFFGVALVFAALSGIAWPYSLNVGL